MKTSTVASGVTALILAAVLSALAGFRPTMPTRWPSRASSMAAASPMPLVAPVTTMTLDSLITLQPNTWAGRVASRRPGRPGYDGTMPEAKLLSADVEPAVERDNATDEALVEDDLLVEDVSIDGMCGVY